MAKNTPPRPTAGAELLVVREFEHGETVYPVGARIAATALPASVLEYLRPRKVFAEPDTPDSPPPPADTEVADDGKAE